MAFFNPRTNETLKLNNESGWDKATFIFTEMSTSYEDCTNNKRKKYYILEEMKNIPFEVIFPLPITYKIVSLESPKSFPGWKISDNQVYKEEGHVLKLQTAEGSTTGL